MSVFSTNQVRQLYVAKELKTPHALATDDAGAIAVKNDTAKTHLYFEYKGADNLMRSDLINIKDIIDVKVTDADNMAYDIKKFTVTLDNSVNGGTPVAGQDYLLRIAFRQYIGMSDEDQYSKYGMVHAYSGMTASEFYKVLAISLAKNFSREVTPLVKIAVKTAASSEEVTPLTKLEDLDDTYTGVIITEAPQPWRRGIMTQVPVYFTVQPDRVVVSGDERIWGTVVEETDGVIDNGKTIADLEYFCMGERGDIYRGMAWPHNIETTYLVDPTQKYNVIDIHYAYVGSNEGVQKSEKTITLVVPKVGANNQTSNKLANDIVTAINTATGLSVSLLDASAG